MNGQELFGVVIAIVVFLCFAGGFTLIVWAKVARYLKRRRNA